MLVALCFLYIEALESNCLNSEFQMNNGTACFPSLPYTQCKKSSTMGSQMLLELGCICFNFTRADSSPFTLLKHLALRSFLSAQVLPELMYRYSVHSTESNKA